MSTIVDSLYSLNNQSSYVAIPSFNVTITPKFASSKILVMANATMIDNQATWLAYTSLFRDSVNLFTTWGTNPGPYPPNDYGYWGITSLQYNTVFTHITDYPASTSSIVYSFRMKSYGPSIITIGYSPSSSWTMTAIEIGQ